MIFSCTQIIVLPEKPTAWQKAVSDDSNKKLLHGMITIIVNPTVGMGIIDKNLLIVWPFFN